MQIRPGHIFAALVLLLLLSSCHRGARRIPRSKMVDIYGEMFLQDEAVRANPEIRKEADTVLVYEGIFEKYGYNTDDYLYSVEYYLRDPDRMAKIMNEVNLRMRNAAREMVPEVELYDWQQEMMKLYEKPEENRFPLVSSPSDISRVVRDTAGSPYFLRILPPGETE